MLLILCGYSASGKDTYQNMLLERNPLLKRAVSHTTRPKRKMEKDGREYHFIKKEDFLEKERSGFFIETREYKTIENGEETTWLYGLSYDSIKEEGDFITILDFQGIKKVLKNAKKVDTKIVYLFSPDCVLKNRSLNRGDEIEEFERRLEDDKMQFIGIEDFSDLVIFSNCEEHEFNLKRIEKLFGGDE